MRGSRIRALAGLRESESLPCFPEPLWLRELLEPVHQKVRASPLDGNLLNVHYISFIL